MRRDEYSGVGAAATAGGLCVAAIVWVVGAGPGPTAGNDVVQADFRGNLGTNSESLEAAAARDANRSTDRFDEPDAAVEHYWLKRQGPTPSHDPVVAYREALRRMDVMPRYSAALGAMIPRKPDTSFPFSKIEANRALQTWIPVGPGNIGGRTRTLLIHPTQPEIMYAGGVSGGVWKTTDGGQSWTALADDIANIAVNSMAMDPSDPEILYAGTGEGYFREIVRGTWLPLRGAGVFKSEDGGSTWSHLPSTDGEDFHWVNDLIASPRDPSRLYAATRTGIHLSADGGRTWAQILNPEVDGGCLDLALRTDRSVDWIFASCGTFEQATIYRRIMNSTGEWEAVLSEPGMGRTSLAIAPSDQSVIYALSASNVPGPNDRYEQALHSVYRSTAGGASGTWRTRVDNTDRTKLNTLLLTNAISASYVECGEADQNYWTPMGWYCNVIAVDPTNPDVVWRSEDGGVHWAALDGTGSGALPDIPVHSIVVDPENSNRLYLGTDLGVFTSLNAGQSWAVENTGFANAVTEWLAIGTDNDGAYWLFAFTHGRGAWKVQLRPQPAPRRPGRRLSF